MLVTKHCINKQKCTLLNLVHCHPHARSGKMSVVRRLIFDRQTDPSMQNRVHAVPMQPLLCPDWRSLHHIHHKGSRGGGVRGPYLQAHACPDWSEINLLLQNFTGEGTVHYFMEFDCLNPLGHFLAE